ncbi:MAG: hypothetical protein ACYSX0_15560 [Planctomycetota bacterium]
MSWRKLRSYFAGLTALPRRIQVLSTTKQFTIQRNLGLLLFELR